MATKSANLYARIEPEVRLPSSKPIDISKLSEAELNAELEKGYADIVAGRTKPAKQAFADIRKDYGL
jgi:DNA-damage-inducible protein J